uniref:Retrovirus-related Pol polyprotein from transposon 412 family n=1 Tax=Cajanus cajan TaxID=3821 RepID=A0A151QXU4_CAJCA|nr:Retrovirus-related Pol polyprotein from transposon 412 family [Cajanus cajan]
MVLVKKNSGKWRMCVDYTDLNKVCPKDSYPLPSIDRLVDGASRHALLSFLDAYSGRVMPFGLKNAGATYQRLMDKVFHQQIGRNMEVYVDDMVVKTTSAIDHAADLTEVFAQVRKHNMRLNPEKCVFGVQGGPIFTLLKKPRDFLWTNQCEEAFQSFKTFLTTPPILQKPDHNTDLLLYLAVAENAISADESSNTILYIRNDKVVNVSDKEDLGWMADIWSYLKEGSLPEDNNEARKIRMRSAKFVIIGDELFKRGISSPLLKCLTTSQAAYVIREIYQGICGMHSRACSMVARVLRAGYYWPTLKSDCQSHIKKCKECQQFGNTYRQPPETLHHMMSAWSFSHILWAYHCTPQSTTQETPYRLTYGVDAMIPVEVGETSHRRQVFNGEQNTQELAADLDLVDKLRNEAQIHEEACKLRASQRYNTRVKPRSFRVGDLVWRLLGEARKDTSDGKLAPIWGGPF